MKRITGVVAVLLAGVGLPRAAADDCLKIGMVQGMFRDVQPGVVQALSQPFRTLMQRQMGLAGEVEVVAGADALAKRIQDQTVHIGVLHGFEYAWVRGRHPDLIPLVVTVPPGRKCQACVVVNKESTAQRFEDLKADDVSIHRGIKAHCLLYLDKIRKASPGAAQPNTGKSVSPEETLGAVVDGTAAAALVDVAALGGYEGLHPGAFKRLRVLCRSESFPPSVIVYKKGVLAEGVVAKLRGGLTQAHQTAQGKPLMMLWNLKGFEHVPADYDVQLDQILKAYPAPAADPTVTPVAGVARPGK